MKKIMSMLLAVMTVISLFAVSAFAAEGKDYNLRVLTFEDEDYKGSGNYVTAKDWSTLIDDPQYGGLLLYGEEGYGIYNKEDNYRWNDENNTFLASEMCAAYGSYAYWSGGHAVSNYVSGEASKYGDYNHQLTVYKKDVEGIKRTGGGHNGSNNFAVHYGYKDGSPYNMTESLPSFYFSDNVARVVDHMYVNNMCYAINCYTDDNGLSAKIGPDDWVKLVATGYDKDGNKVEKQAEIYLCNGPDNIVTDWTKWDLSVLGEVTKIEFNITGSSDNGYGFSQPAYFAYDDVAVRFPKTQEELDADAAAEVEELIGEIGTVTKDSGEAIKAARDAYAALTDAQKELVSKEAVAALEKAEKVFAMIMDSSKPDASDKTGISNESVIKIGAAAAENGKENPSTGAPVMSIAPAIFVLAAAAFALKK